MKENRHLEFKSDNSDSFLKTVSAYANYEGGRILFGVDDSGKPVGIKDIDKKCLAIENKINDTIKPQPDYILSVNSSRNTITLEVRPGSGKPYFYKSKAYKRNDTSTIEVDRLELKRLIMEGDNLDYEGFRSKEQDLNFDVLAAELKDKVGIEEMTRDILKSLNLYSDKEGYNNAAFILADKNTLPGIDIVRFGETINIFTKRLTLEDQSILRSFGEAVAMFKDYYQYEEVKGTKRKTVEMIPEEAFREALANALIHRVWDINTPVKISMFDDSVEIVSAGGLPSGISEANYLSGNLSVLRNPILAGIFYRLGMIEMFGTGIRRIRNAYSGSSRKPSFEVDSSMIKVTLPVMEDHRLLTEDEATICNVLSRNRSRQINEIMTSGNINMGKTKVTNLLNGLSDKGVVEIEGRGRGTRYRIV
ncbi:MAG: putative DNA binding domain-containing protein [Saccharofermentans sp.]|nr:putative DNA binding domain-containing protein [Saccharofermentans sp.]